MPRNILASLSKTSTDIEAMMSASRTDLDEICQRMAELENRNDTHSVGFTSGPMAPMLASSSQSSGNMVAEQSPESLAAEAEQVSTVSPYSAAYLEKYAKRLQVRMTQL